MKVLASLLPFLASTENEGESQNQEDCVMMIDVVNGEKLCVKNPEMGAMGDFFRYRIEQISNYWLFLRVISNEIFRGKRKQAKGKGNQQTTDSPETQSAASNNNYYQFRFQNFIFYFLIL